MRSGVRRGGFDSPVPARKPGKGDIVDSQDRTTGREKGTSWIRKTELPDEADRGRHPGFARHGGLAGGPGSLSLTFVLEWGNVIWLNAQGEVTDS